VLFRSPLHHLGEYLIVLYGRGDLGIDSETDLVRRIILNAPSGLRRHIIEFIGRSFRSDEDLPSEVIDRFVKLWDLYWPECGQADAEEVPSYHLFGEWFVSGQFPREWAIKQLVEFAKTVGVPEPDHLVGEKLVEYISDDLESCMIVLDQMVRGDKEHWHIRSFLEPAKTILSAALAQGGELKEKATCLINHLGRRGFTEMGGLLNSQTDN